MTTKNYNKTRILSKTAKEGKTIIRFKYSDEKGTVKYAEVKEDSLTYRKIFEVKPEDPIKIRNGKHKMTYTFKWRGASEMIRQVEQVYLKAKTSFKINVAMGMVLVNNITKEVREYNWSTNTRVFDKPFTINNMTSYKEFLSKFQDKDLVDIYLKARANSKWKFQKFIEYALEVYPLKHTIGAHVSLPLYIIKNKSIYGLNNFADNLCFWRCLAMNRGCKNPKRSSAQAKTLFYEYYQHKNYKTYAGVQLHDNELNKIEKHFKTNINVYTLNEETSSIQRGQLKNISQ
jgi:hypothetical protein